MSNVRVRAVRALWIAPLALLCVIILVQNVKTHPRINYKDSVPDNVFFVTQGVDTFDKSKWLKNASSESRVRACMVYDLVHTYPLIGMTRTEIHALLGQPFSVPLLQKELGVTDSEPYYVFYGQYFSLKYFNDRVIAFRIDQAQTGCKVHSKTVLSRPGYWFTENFSKDRWNSEPAHSSSRTVLAESDLRP
jgi:hypothetical protein